MTGLGRHRLWQALGRRDRYYLVTGCVKMGGATGRFQDPTSMLRAGQLSVPVGRWRWRVFFSVQCESLDQSAWRHSDRCHCNQRVGIKARSVSNIFHHFPTFSNIFSAVHKPPSTTSCFRWLPFAETVLQMVSELPSPKDAAPQRLPVLCPKWHLGWADCRGVLMRVDGGWWGLMASVVGIRFGILAKPIYTSKIFNMYWGLYLQRKQLSTLPLHLPIHPTSFCPLSHLALGTCSTKVYAQGDHGATGGREEFGRKRPQGACGGVLGQVFGRGFGELGAHRTEGWQDGKIHWCSCRSLDGTSNTAAKSKSQPTIGQEPAATCCNNMQSHPTTRSRVYQSIGIDFLWFPQQSFRRYSQRRAGCRLCWHLPGLFGNLGFQGNFQLIFSSDLLQGHRCESNNLLKLDRKWSPEVTFPARNQRDSVHG